MKRLLIFVAFAFHPSRAMQTRAEEAEMKLDQKIAEFQAMRSSLEQALQEIDERRKTMPLEKWLPEAESQGELLKKLARKARLAKRRSANTLKAIGVIGLGTVSVFAALVLAALAGKVPSKEAIVCYIDFLRKHGYRVSKTDNSGELQGLEMHPHKPL